MATALTCTAPLMATHVCVGACVCVHQGGYFVWVKLPKGVSCKAMLEACATPDDAGTCATFHIGPKYG